jgi:hypothetical protein
MHLLYGDFFALYKFNNQSINQSTKILKKKQLEEGDGTNP